MSTTSAAVAEAIAAANETVAAATVAAAAASFTPLRLVTRPKRHFPDVSSISFFLSMEEKKGENHRRKSEQTMNKSYYIIIIINALNFSCFVWSNFRNCS